jgi:molecular chaperone GrpE
MSERRDASTGDGEPQVKVVDRRRFTPEGDPVEREAPASDPAPAGGAAAPAEQAGPDPRDARLAEQAARIEELSRAYAALVEDHKAFRQRLEREKVRVIEAERANVAQALLEAADDLERALAAASKGGEDGAGGSPDPLVDGLRLSLGTLHKRIADLGAERIPVAGQRFDPRVAEAVDTVPVADVEQDGLVVEEVRAGYHIGDRVLRPARVRVGRIARA